MMVNVSELAVYISSIECTLDSSGIYSIQAERLPIQYIFPQGTPAIGTVKTRTFAMFPAF